MVLRDLVVIFPEPGLMKYTEDGMQKIIDVGNSCIIINLDVFSHCTSLLCTALYLNRRNFGSKLPAKHRLKITPKFR